MSRKIKYSKIAIVAFLTVLIWVWADLELDETLLVRDVSVTIVKSSNPALWATFKSGDKSPVLSITIEHIVLKGRTSRIAAAKRELSNSLLNLDFTLNPELQEMTKAGSYSLGVLDFLKRRSNDIEELTGLTVESCEPNTLAVNVEIFVETSMPVKCFLGESQSPRDVQNITPETVTMYVPEGWGGKPARVELTPGEIEQARSQAIEEKPFVVLEGGLKRYANERVQVRMPPEEDKLKYLKVEGVTVGYCFSPNTHGKYTVKLEKPDDVMSNIEIKATPQAQDDYQALRYHVYLEIYDEDAETTDWVPRILKYGFPEEHVRDGDIKLAQDPVEARFKLIPVKSGDGS